MPATSGPHPIRHTSAWSGPHPTHQLPYSLHSQHIPQTAVNDKMSQRKREKAAGIEKKRRKFIIEETYDDCGADLGGICPYIIAHATDYMAMPVLQEDSEG